MIHRATKSLALCAYILLAFVLYSAAFIILLLLSFKQKYRESIPARFFLFRNTAPKHATVWIHACSLGETKAVMPIAESFDDVLLTVTTQTGMNEAHHANIKKAAYLPFELFMPFWAPSSVKLLIVMEAELWLMLFACAKKRGAKTVLINARISDRSFHSYMKYRFFYRFVFSFVDVVYAQSDVDAKRLRMLGARHVDVLGNIKERLPERPTEIPKTDKKLHFIAASTHKGEEELIVNAFLKANISNARLIVVPRHPERFEAVHAFLYAVAKSRHIRYARYSQTHAIDSADVVLVDCMGKLMELYAIAYLVILGGSFVPVGGHNPLEPAFFHTKLISGTHIFNQKTAFARIDGVRFCDANDLVSLLCAHDTLAPSDIKPGNDVLEVATRKLHEFLA